MTLSCVIAAGAAFGIFGSPGTGWKAPGEAPFFGFETRADGAARITDTAGSGSCQNPVFSPDSCHLMFTRFQNGYNQGPSELVQIKIDGSSPRVVVSAGGADNVCAPYGSWMGNRITWASDRAGGAEEIFIADDDGGNIQQVTSHPESQGYYIEPVFNPRDTDKIAFEYGASDTAPHHIWLLELDEGGRITALTNDSLYDDRLPSWSQDGSRILFQRNAVGGEENWEIYAGTVTLGSSPSLTALVNISRVSSQETDNSWSYHDRHVLSSTDYGGVPAPNIFAFPSSGAGAPVRITYSNDREDGAPAYSPDGKWIAFESHEGNEESPTEIWILPAPPLPVARFGPGDYDGDGTAEAAVFRPDAGWWAVRGLTAVYFGGMGDVPVPHDYNGDGSAEFAVFRPAAGLWAARGITRLYFGSTSDFPVPGDYDGDGRAEPAVFRRESGLWAVRGVTRLFWGSSRDLPVPVDYSGDGRDEPAVFRSAGGLWAVKDLTRMYFGSGGHVAAPGDYDGDGAWEPAVFIPSSARWAIRGVTEVYFGQGYGWPASADYDGDSRNEVAVFFDSSGHWAVRGLTSVYFGSAGDMPVAR